LAGSGAAAGLTKVLPRQIRDALFVRAQTLLRRHRDLSGGVGRTSVVVVARHTPNIGARPG
jgi:hypothetical protein